MTNVDASLTAEIVERAPDGVVVVDQGGLIRYWNQGMTRIFGFDADDVLGGPLDVIIPERLRQRHNEAFAAAVARGTTRYGDDDLLAVPATGKGDRSLSIEFSIVLLTDNEGSVGHVAAIIRDVTQRWNRDRETRRRLRELEAATGRPSDG